MPTIKVSEKELKELTGAKNMKKLLSYLKAEIEKRDKGILHIELKDTNRPDLFSVEGLARAIRVFKKKKPTKYRIKGRGVEIKNRGVKARPHIAACVVKNISLTKTNIKGIMKLQELLDKTIGRNRKKTSIGLYDFDKIKPPVVYTTTKKNKNAFVPLEGSKKMTPGQIMKEHEKAEEYGHIIEGKKYPIFLDSKKQVLSFPPIINSNKAGKISTKTKNIMIEVTGTDKQTVEQVLDIVCFALAERKGEIYYGKLGKQKFPKTKREKMEFSLVKLNEIAGFEINNYGNLLKKMDYEIEKTVGKQVIVGIPAYRKDIMSQIDIIEDIIIAHGYKKIEPEMPDITFVGDYDQSNQEQRIKIIGAGFQEIQTFILGNPETSKKLGIKTGILLENPMSKNYSHLRTSLIPGIIEFLSKNTHVEYPQKIFEIGQVIDSKAKSHKNLCAASCHSSTDFTKGKQIMESVFGELRFKAYERPPFIKGRSAKVYKGRRLLGYLGEVHPKYLNMFNIFNPVVLFEVENIDKIFKR